MRVFVLLLVILGSWTQLSLGEPERTYPAKREFPVNREINPCEDFYAYACSKAQQAFQLPEDRAVHIFSFHDSAERILAFKKKYLRSLSKKQPKNRREAELRDVYQACTNQSARAKEEKQVVVREKKRIAAIQTKEAMERFFANNISEVLMGLLLFSTELSTDGSGYQDVLFETPMMTLPEKSYYKNRSLMAELKARMLDFFRVTEHPNPEQAASWVLDFETKLAEVVPTPSEFRGLLAQENSVSQKEIAARYPALKLELFFRKLPSRTKVRDLIPNAMEYLNAYVQNAKLDQLRAIYLYFSLYDVLDEAYPEYFNQWFQFRHKYLGGSKKRRSLQERCTRTVMSQFGMEIDSLLVKKMFPTFPKERFRKFVERIRTALIATLKENQWLSPNGKKEAIRKIKKAKLHLLYPRREKDWGFNLPANYSSTNYLANQQLWGRLLLKKTLDELPRKANQDLWDSGPLTINAYYYPMYNRFVIPIGILQFPFYDPAESDEINMGAIGSVIGHELGHAIDDAGSAVNADGKLLAWLTKGDQVEFKKRTRKLVEQFNQAGQDGAFTLGENIGDLVGLSTAYRAVFGVRKTRSRKTREMKRRFFLQYARAWCEVQREDTAKLRMKTDPHALGYARANEQIKHQPGFAEAYGCKVGDPLVLPKEKVLKIW